MIFRPWMILLMLLAAPLAVLAQEAAPTFELEELEIVGQQERWPTMFDPYTRIEPGLAPAEAADRYAYRAAEFEWAANQYRAHVYDRSWPDRLVFGDGHFTRLYHGWVSELEGAAERSRVLSVRYRLVAWDVVQIAALEERRALQR